MYLCPYLNNGVFNLLIFDKDKILNNLNINDLIGIDDKTRPNDNFPDPFMNSCFIDRGKVFINVFHSKLLCMYHFTYSYFDSKITSSVVTT